MRRDWFGMGVATFLAFAIVVISWGLVVWVIEAPRDSVEQCIRDIPNDVDAIETAYMEQECHAGIRVR